MIHALSGKILELLPNGAVVDVNGVGYGLEIPLSTLCMLPARGEPVQLSVHTYVREDSIRLFGFSSQAEKEVFEILISLSGIGPKVALAILSTLSLIAIQDAVRFEQSQVFESVPGVGKRLSERLLVDLKPKLKRIEGALSQLPKTIVDGSNAGKSPAHVRDRFIVHLDDVQSALENLGFKEKLVLDTINQVRLSRPSEDFQELMRIALQIITGATAPTDAKRSPGATAAAGTDTDLF